MTYKTILVHCDADKELAHRLGVAADLAVRLDGHLVGLHVRPPFQPPVVFDSGFAVAMDDFYKLYEETVNADQSAARAAFDQAIKGRKCSSEWRLAEGPIDSEVATQSRYADLVVVGQSNLEGAPRTPPDLPQYVALACGRPLLIVPYVGVQQPPGKTVMLCWNESRESARAASEALPLLKAASQVVVLIVEPAKVEGEAGNRPAANIETWFGRHGVKASVHRDVAAGTDIGSLILSRAADYNADLIVMGLYGHSRAREFVLGGASRTILGSMTVPVLVAH